MNTQKYGYSKKGNLLIDEMEPKNIKDNFIMLAKRMKQLLLVISQRGKKGSSETALPILHLFSVVLFFSILSQILNFLLIHPDNVFSKFSCLCEIAARSLQNACL